MSINHLSALRIAGEVGLGIGTISGGACAASYGGQIIAQNAQIKEHDKKVSEIEKGWEDWIQYGISCLNSINDKAFVSTDNESNLDKVKEAWKKAKQEALDCKGHIKDKTEGKFPKVKWVDKSPSATAAGKSKKLN